jgi:predicted ATPase/class 3 adenylate cyclase
VRIGAVRDLPTGTVTFLFTDVEGSTRLLDELGAERYAEELERHRHALRTCFARYGGVEVDTQGDAFFVAFPTADSGLAAAREAQRALDAGPIRVRMGLHSGDPLVTDTGYVGMEVHRGARIAAAGHGGQVLVSETTRRALTDGGDLRDLGEHRLKDLAAPIRLYQLGEADFPPLNVLYRATLPVQPSSLLGRERELEEAARLLAAGRLVTLTGAGGSGKTRLALQIAAEAVDDFPDGVFWVALAAVVDPELVPPTIAAAIGAEGPLAAHIADKRMLLLLDNLEQVLGAAPALGELSSTCPNLKLLVTSRSALRLAGEQEYEVEPLPLGDAEQLFSERARAVVPAFEPDAAVEAICRRLDGLPLAVELAAARVRVFTPAELAARLEQRLPVLTGGSRDAPERQQTLRATIEWSHDLLDGDEQRLFRRLGVFAGSFDVAAAEAICAMSFDVVEALVAQSLVRRWASGRLGMLETIREFALEQLRDSGDADVLALAHLEYFLTLAEARAGNPHTLEVVAGLDAERDNFRAALRWALDNGRGVLALRLAGALGEFWVVRAHQEGYGWLAEALEAARDDAPPDVRANALMWAGSTLFFTGDYVRSYALVEEALQLFREIGDDARVADLLDRIAAGQTVQGEFDAARALAEESLELFRKLGDRAGTMHPLSKIAGDEWRRGHVSRAVELQEEALELAREAGDAWATSIFVIQLSEMVAARKELERAGSLAREGVSLAREIGNAPSLVYGFTVLALLAATGGDMRRAGTLWGAAEALAERGEVMIAPNERAGYEEQFPVEDATFAADRAEGSELSLDDAVAYALAG